MNAPICLPLSQWPAGDLDLWHAARSEVSFLSGPQPAQKWSLARRRIVEQSYGQWLAFLLATGQLQSDAPPVSRVTPDRLEAFVRGLTERIAPISVVVAVQGLKHMLSALEPGCSLGLLANAASRLKRQAKPSRDKRPHMVRPSQLFELGRLLFTQAESDPDRYHSATMARDGLLIALLICCPVRIANLARITIGRHLQFEGGRYLLAFEAEETKNGRPLEGELPLELTPMLDRYLEHYRSRLLARGASETSRALWIDRWGAPMRAHSIRAQVEKCTQHAFGRPIWPHLFRSIAATGFVDLAPDDVRMLPDLLGHADASTAHRHYVLADATRAHMSVQASLVPRRAEALERLGLTKRRSGAIAISCIDTNS